ncbi:DUF3160 domain-containing protein [Paraliomyxa miuraensis]|uniref:DUF3160 domain-containing protein n=1 Tax=Paraliomyxa miuraensis TaxID=376150 RepID=UPI00225B1BC2|nr:DUF3160 domain-containing protein [Paraliomyxa miuraensis]MCX4241720.1 DUF3160 domain-containing protein [Paraliomyxa miuraensis]
MSATLSTIALRRCCAALLLVLACQREPTAAAEAQPESQPEARPEAAAPSVVAPADVASREEARRLRAAFEQALATEGELSARDLEQRMPAFRPAHGLDVPAATHYQGFVKAFALTEAERERLHALGFVVVPPRGPAGAGPVDVYYRVFAADLPVFISADSVLHAWHRSYDDVLERTEESALLPMLTTVLDGLDAALDEADPAQRDAKLHLAVARTLLNGPWRGPTPPAEIAPILAAVEGKQRAIITMMGAEIEHDFSQFIPRGHYRRTEALQRYFEAMMWLGRMDLRLHDPKIGAPPNPREEAAARALAAALARSGQQEAFEAIERFYRLHVGRPNALTPADLQALCAKAGAPDCAGRPTDMTAQYAAQGGPAYVTKTMAGSDASRTRPSAVPVTMRLFPQRFAYDAWVTAQTTSPALPPVTGPGARTMASPYDVAHALGSDRAVVALADELALPERAALPGRLAATRATLQAIQPTALDETLYNHWLQALMAVARTDLDPRLPAVMQTAAWHDHRMETVLASWAELRHDTVLSVEQSEAFFGCQYPQGYVEPLPELHRELDEAAAHLVAFYEGDSMLVAQDPFLGSVPAWAAHFREVMQRLARLSEQELRGEPMSAEDLAFLNRTVDRHADDGYGGTRSYDGWYPALYWNPMWTNERKQKRDMGGSHHHTEGGEAEPIVTDVHTDGAHDTVLEMGTGYPELMVVVVDQGGDVAVYGGPVSSVYAFERPSTERMTDQEWAQAIVHRALPERPAFARTYRAQ